MTVPVHGADAFIEGFGRNEKVRWHEYMLVIDWQTIDKRTYVVTCVHGRGIWRGTTFSSRPVER